MINQKYTADTLAALPDAELDALAAKVKGWNLWQGFWNTADGKQVQPGGLRAIDWQPTRDANQAFALLSYAVKQGADFMVRMGGNRPRIVIFGETLITIPGTADARAMTIAFILAMQEVSNG